jgi:Ca2+-binding RTX toxin-like protein
MGVPIVGSEFVVDNVTDGRQRLPEVAALADGGFAIAWITLLSNPAFGSLHYRTYTGEGTPEEGQAALTAMTVSTAYEDRPELVGQPTNTFLGGSPSNAFAAAYVETHVENVNNVITQTWTVYRSILSPAPGPGYSTGYIPTDVASLFVPFKTDEFKTTYNPFIHATTTSPTGIAFGGSASGGAPGTGPGGWAVNGTGSYFGEPLIFQIDGEEDRYTFVDEAGQVRWGSLLNGGVNGCFVVGDGTHPITRKLSTGQWVVTWENSGVLSAKVVDVDGVARQPTIPVDGSGASEAHVVALDDGRFMLVWRDSFLQNTGTVLIRHVEIKGQIYNSNGSPNSDAFTIDSRIGGALSSSSLDLGAPRVEKLKDGRVVLTYHDGVVGQGTETDIIARIIDPREHGVTVNGSVFDDQFVGSLFADILNGNGNDGNDRLYGGGGADTMTGGIGNDTYMVDNVGDKVIESDGGGTDNVRTLISFGLGAGNSVEVLQTFGGTSSTAPINLTGNGIANNLIGNAAANILNGGGGADILQGQAGNDTYIVDSAADRIVEAGGSGTDNVRALKSYALSNGISVEVMQTYGGTSSTAPLNFAGNNGANNLIGNAAANVLNGNAGNDLLQGMGGNDTLVGGPDADTFRFNTPLLPSNVDTIRDFNVVADTIQLEDAVFVGLAAGTLAAAAFRIGLSAADSNDRIVYNSTTGALIFDSNGNASGGAIQFAKLSPGLALTNADFVVI